MPTFYEGEPIVRVKQTLTEREYCRAALIQKTMATPFSRRGVKTGASLTGAALLASCAPWYRQWDASWLIPLAGAACLLLLACWFFFAESASVEGRAARVYRSHALCRLPAEITLYRDSMEYRSEAEIINAYYTDFSACYECASSFLFVGGIDRDLLVVMKEAMLPGEAERLSTHLKETFTTRYRRVRR